MMIETSCRIKNKKVRAQSRYGVFSSAMPRFEPYSPKLIKNLRDEKGYKSQKDFAEASGINLNTIKRLEAGMVKPGLETLSKLGGFFGIYIYADWEQEKSPD